MIVVDTNIIAYLYLPTELTDQAERLLLNEPEWAAPFLWRSEFRNVLALYLRKNILSIEAALKIQAEAEALMKGCEYQSVSFDVMQLVAASSCSAYDCEFVALAQALNTNLVTMDKKILKDFPKFAVSLKNYL